MKFPVQRYLLVFCTLLGLILTGCGSSPATTSSTNDMTLKVGQVTNAIAFFPLYVALQKGYFKDGGLTLNPDNPPSLGSGSKLATAVEANSIDIGVGGLTDAFTISRIDAHIKLIGAVSTNYLLDVVVSKNFEQETHLTATSPLADKVKALVGRKVGISAPNSASDALLTYLFRQQHLDAEKDVTKVNLGAAIPANLAALKAGRIDATVVTPPGNVIAEVQGIGDTFISPARGDVPSMSGQLFGISFIKQNVIDAKPKAVRAFIRAMAQAEQFIQTHEQESMTLLATYLKLDQKAINPSWNIMHESIPQNPQITQQSYNTANQFHVDAGLIVLPLAYKDLVATDTINQALSRQ